MMAAGPFVLIVDDDETFRNYLIAVLSRAGYNPVAAARGEDALRHLERGTKFELALIDVVMPGMPGDEFARELRRVHPDCKVLFVTGYPGALFQAKPILWNGEAFLEKPFTDHGLLEAMCLLLTGRIEVPPPKQPQSYIPTSDDFAD